MKILACHYEQAARRTGLDTLSGPIHIDDLRKLEESTARLAEVLARHEVIT